MGVDIRQRKTILDLRGRIEAGVQQTDTRADHANFQAQVGEMLDEVLQGDIIDFEAVPKLVDSDFAVLAIE